MATKFKQGRPRIDRSGLLGKVSSGTDLLITKLSDPDLPGKRMAFTTCMRLNKETGSECGITKWLRLDRILAKETIACGCLKVDLYNGWCKAQAQTLSDETCSRIWDLNQDGTHRALQAAFPRLYGGTLRRVISQRQVVIDKALADHGQAIRTRMKMLRDCVDTGREFGLSGTAIRWIMAAAEKKPAVTTVLTKEQELDADYLAAFKRLRATVEDTGWGKRQRALFNRDELTISRTGDINGSIMRVYWWAEKQTAMNPELDGLWIWLCATIENTRRYRKEQRKAHAIMADRQAA
jgi:hypothetical protein